MSKNNYSVTTQKYLNSVRRYLKEKFGKVNPEWEQPLEILGDNLELYQDCKQSIKNDGLLLMAKNGAYTKNPLIKVMMDAQIQITKLISEFGLSPKSASKINIINDDDDDLRELLGE
jgi:P27 family predicted phage terminase small subunit